MFPTHTDGQKAIGQQLAAMTSHMVANARRNLAAASILCRPTCSRYRASATVGDLVTVTVGCSSSCDRDAGLLIGGLLIH